MPAAHTFALIGAAGFVARRHVEAIRDVGGVLIGALDLHDSVGMLDSYFPDCRFFSSPERFDRWLNKTDVDYVSICSPNWLHDAHCRWALRSGAHAICEKPLVINTWNVDQLASIETETGRNVYPILQLRCHPQIQAIKESIASGTRPKWNLHLEYVTRRGRWYHDSWKGDDNKSGGVAMNLGIHLFDAMAWMFESDTWEVIRAEVASDRAEGLLRFGNHNLTWRLSTRQEDLRKDTVDRDGYANRYILDLDTADVLADFSEGFTSLHTDVYRRILANDWMTAVAARPGIELVSAIREAASS